MNRFSDFFYNLLNRLPFKKSLMLLFLSVFLIPTIILSVFYVLFLYRTMIDFEMDKVSTSLVQSEERINDILQEIRLFSDRIYVNRQLQRVILTKYDDIQDLYSDYSELGVIESYVHAYDEVLNFRIYTENETLLENSFIKKTNERILAEKWYENALSVKGQPFWISKYDEFSKKEYLSLVRSVWSYSNGNFIGVLVVNVNPEEFFSVIEGQVFDAAIAFDNKIMFSSYEKSSEINLVLNRLLAEQKYEHRELNNASINGENFRVAAVDFYPKNSVSVKFVIIYMIPMKQLNSASLTVIFVTLVIIALLIFLSAASITGFSTYMKNRVTKIQNGIESVVQNNFEIPSTIGGNDEFEAIYSELYKMSKNISELINKVYVQDLEKEQISARQNEMRYKMLSTQINPHFLFNTLETIRMKSLASGEKEVSTMLKLLASLLRYNLSVSGKPVPLYNELEAVQNYLNIQHIRFGSRVSYDIITTCNVQKITILPLLIQPIVENSFTHGLENTVSDGFIYIFITSEEKNEKTKIVIEVKDNGCGMEQKKLENLRAMLNSDSIDENEKSIGMKNVNSRIKLFYGKDSGVQIESEKNKGTTVTITLFY